MATQPPPAPSPQPPDPPAVPVPPRTRVPDSDPLSNRERAAYAVVGMAFGALLMFLCMRGQWTVAPPTTALIRATPRLESNSDENSWVRALKQEGWSGTTPSRPDWSQAKVLPSTVLDVNVAPAEELQALPGIGPTLAQRIVDTRKVQPFARIDDLRRVHGIGVKTLEKLRPYIRVSAARPTSAGPEG